MKDKIDLRTLVVHYYLFIVQVEKTTPLKDIPTWLLDDKRIIEREVLRYD